MNPALRTLLFGGPPSWLPRADGLLPSNFADYRTEGAGNRYWNAATQQANAAAWWASRGTGSTFARASVKNVPAVSTGILTQFASGAAAYTADPGTLKSLGRSYEGGRTNLALWSEAFDNAAWTTFLTSITANQTTAPDGNVTADTYTASVGNNAHEIFSTTAFSFTSGQPYVLDVFAKQNTWRYLQLPFWTAPFGSTAYANFDLQTGTVGGFGATASAGIIAYPNGWYRCWVLATATSTANGGWQASIPSSASDSKNAAWSPAGTESVYLWGAEVKAAAFPDSYTATTTGSVARAADSQSLTRVAPTSITKVIAFRVPPTSTLNAVAFYIGDGTTATRVQVYREGSNNHLTVLFQLSSVTIASLDMGLVSDNADVVLAASVGSGGVSASLNGGAPVTGTGSSIPGTFTAEYEGSRPGGQELFSTIKGSAEWTNFAASNAALQALSGSSYWN